MSIYSEINCRITKNEKEGYVTAYRRIFSFILVLSLSLMSFSCGTNPSGKSSTEKSFTWNSIPLEKGLFGKKYQLDELIMPGRLLYKNGKLVIKEQAPGDTFLHVLDGSTLEYLFTTGAVGQGPGEMPSAWALDSGLDPGSFWVQSLEGKLISQYSLENTGDPHAIQQIRQQGDFFLAMGVASASDSTWITFLADGEDKYVEFKADGKRVGSFGKWKGLIPGDVEDHVIADLHQGKLMGDPEMGKFIKASIFRDRLEILNSRNGQIIGVNGPENTIPEFRGVDKGVVTSSDHPLAYMDAFLGKEYIYGLYSGKTDREIMEEGRGETMLLVFDLTGEVIALLRLDIPISGFSVDEDRNRIIGITTDREPGVVVFEFSFE